MMNIQTYEAARRLGAEYGVPQAHVAALIEVESAGVYQPCQIRFEGHYFYARLTEPTRSKAVKAGLAAAKMGVVKNPNSMTSRYALLARAKVVDANAAIESTSYGVGQVMGAHWKALGYVSPQALEAEALSGLEGQARLMMRYVQTFGLLDELKAGLWTPLARGYNGPAYRKFKYDTKLAAAAKKYGGLVPASDGMLRMGAKGARVRELQALLVRAGYVVKADGDFGPSTRDSVKALQKLLGLTVDGVVGPETMRAFSTYRSSPDEKLGVQKLVDIKQVKDAAIAAIPGVGGAAGAAEVLDGLKGQVEVASGQLSVFSGMSTLIDYVQSGLTVAAVGIGIGLAGYAVYGWWKSRHTYEGVSTPSDEGVLA